MVKMYVIKLSSDDVTSKGENVKELREKAWQKYCGDQLVIGIAADELDRKNVDKTVQSMRGAEKIILENLVSIYWQHSKELNSALIATEIIKEIRATEGDQIKFDKEAFSIIQDGYKKMEVRPIAWLEYSDVLKQVYKNEPVEIN
ncbi:MAG: hypothetical protein HQK96_08330 [Nitrospirae bacterium]|nr:hypothetical protein [Nitrospirota bacterium]